MDRENEVEVIHNLAAAKRRLLNNFFVVGILEQFEETLDLFSFMLPKFYKGGTSVYRVVVSTSRIFCKRLSFSVKKLSRVILGRTTFEGCHFSWNFIKTTLYNSKNVQATKIQTRSLLKNDSSLSVEAVKRLKTVVLNYEYDFYDMARSLFNERLRYVKLLRSAGV